MPENKKQNVSCDASSSDEYPYEMCKLRYSQKRFLELNELFKYEPIALLTVDRYYYLIILAVNLTLILTGTK